MRPTWLVILCFVSFGAFADEISDAQAALTKKDFVSAIRILRKPAEEGSARAQALLAFILGYGDLSVRNPDESAAWAQKSAAQEWPMGRTMLGLNYMTGRGVPVDSQKAIGHFNVASAAGEPLATLQLGEMMLVGQGTPVYEDEGVRLIERALSLMPELHKMGDVVLEQRSALSQWRLGQSRLTCGMGCAFAAGSSKAAMRADFNDSAWVPLAARVLKTGYSDDLNYFYLGRAAEGIGALEAAIPYYERAAQPVQGVTPCKFAGFNNCDGVDVPRESTARLAAVRLSLRERANAQAAERRAADDAAARARRAEEEARLALAEEQRHRDVMTTIDDLKRQATAGSAESALMLAGIYASGRDVGADAKESFRWLARAAQSGSSTAQYQLGEAYRLGKGVPKDDVKAESWYARAAAQGDIDAEKQLEDLKSARLARAAERAAEAAAAQRQQELDRAAAEKKKKEENAQKLRSLEAASVMSKASSLEIALLGAFKWLVIAAMLLLVAATLGLAVMGVAEIPGQARHPDPIKLPPPISVPTTAFVETLIEQASKTQGASTPSVAGSPSTLAEDTREATFRDQAARLWQSVGQYQLACGISGGLTREEFIESLRQTPLKTILESYGVDYGTSQDAFIKSVLAAPETIKQCRSGKTGIFFSALEFHRKNWDQQQRRSKQFSEQEIERVKAFEDAEARRLATKQAEAIRLFTGAAAALGLFMLVALVLIFARVEANLRGVHIVVRAPTA